MFTVLFKHFAVVVNFVYFPLRPNDPGVAAIKEGDV
jgi:hypothetical protein